MDGWGFAAALKAQRIDIPVLVMTAAGDGRRWAQEINAAGYVPKPLDFDRVLGLLNQLTGE
jgi:DNA-binding NtrC family response regulator